MKFQDLLLPLGLGLLTTWAIQYMFFPKKESTADDVQTFVAPTTKQEMKPLQLEVDFLDVQPDRDPETCAVDTPWGNLLFSTNGASLQQLIFKRDINGKVQELQTIAPIVERENTPFLIALSEKTPYVYELSSCTRNDLGTQVTFEAKTKDIIISKIFFIHDATHTIDLTLSVTPKGDPVSVRLLLPSPALNGLEDDVISSIVVTKQDQFGKITRKSLAEQQGWLSPQIFGADDRYFVHAMVKDEQNFAQRAYYKFTGKNELVSILESHDIQKPTTWKVSFYCGPKDLYDLTAVDNRLEKTLEYYGMFSSISKFLLTVLRWIYSYLHNYGLAIIALTVLVKLLLLPVTLNSDRSMKDRLEFQKKLAYLRQRYKNDPEALQREQAELLKTQGFAGMGGCLPMLMQIPFFFGLSRLLSGSIELYQAPMGWIPNLAARDPYYILPIIVCVALLIQASSGDSSMDAKQRLTSFAMAFFLGAVTVNLSAGLALYICVNTVLSVLQTNLVRYFRR